ncbi:MAG: hypothetical protein FWG99_09000 [Treponema sp.]|nr:hypothetical protein [Treponema sp.]
MLCCPPCKNLTIPDEYREVADALFPPDGFLPGQVPDLKTAADFAEALGISVDYHRLLVLEKNNEGLKTYLDHFQNNLDLLIQKTWVEKADETRKEKLQDDIPPFITLIEHGNFQQAIEEFGAILVELAYLFFGTQSTKDDFTEYTFRIDAQMGLFWWYGGRITLLKGLSEKNESKNAQSLWAVLLLGLCYLTNF